MRITNHNKRVPSARHNDRNFDLSTAKHIDPSRTKYNAYWTCYGSNTPFAEAEERAYNTLFTDGLNASNKRHIANRHPERVRNMAAYMESKQTCPEEVLYYIGSKQDTDKPNAQTLWNITMQLLKWQRKTYPQCRILDLALHQDEQGAPHIHVRQVWIGHDRDGNNIVSQTKALREMGIERPYPGEKQGRYNNPKQTFTAAVRAKYMALCMEQGLDVDIIPQETSKSGLAHLDYQAQQARQEVKQLKQAVATMQRQKEQLQQDLEWYKRGSVLRVLDPDFAERQNREIRQHLKDTKDVLDR